MHKGINLLCPWLRGRVKNDRDRGEGCGLAQDTMSGLREGEENKEEVITEEITKVKLPSCVILEVGEGYKLEREENAKSRGLGSH